jgi:hypothetical protein
VDEFSEDEFSEDAEQPAPPRLSWASVVGAAFGLALGAILVHWGFWPALVALLLALAGGWLGRHYVGD